VGSDARADVEWHVQYGVMYSDAVEFVCTGGYGQSAEEEARSIVRGNAIVVRDFPSHPVARLVRRKVSVGKWEEIDAGGRE
jgi:hypothetical protein